MPEPGACLIRMEELRSGAPYLVLSGAVETNGETLCLQTAHNISAVYELRQTHQRNYLRVFLVLDGLCALLSR